MLSLGNFQPQMPDPNTYLKQYASENGISETEAKEELRSKYGDPSQPNMQDISIFAGQQNNQSQNLNFDYSDYSDYSEFDFDESSATGESEIKNIFQRLLNLLKNGNGPQKEGDPEHHLNNDETNRTDGPQKEGDPQPHLQNTQDFNRRNEYQENNRFNPWMNNFYYA